MSYTKVITYRGTRKLGAIIENQVSRNHVGFSPIPSQTICNHSPVGFNWGYGGSGPAQLALALLLDVCSDRELASQYHQRFKDDVVSQFGVKWEITDEQVRDWVKDNKED